MDDATATALRVKKIELSLRAAGRGAEIQAHRCIAVLAVGLTMAASATLAGLGQQLPIVATIGAAGVGGGLVLLQLRALRLVAADLDKATAKAMRAIDKSMTEEGESNVDAEADGP